MSCFRNVAYQLRHTELLEWARHKYPHETFDPNNTHIQTVNVLMELNNKNACNDEAKEELAEIYFFRTGRDPDDRFRGPRIYRAKNSPNNR